MIHDATVEVTCDSDDFCWESETIPLSYVFSNYSGKSGRYDDDDSKIEQELENRGWIIANGKHFCCYGCAHPKV